MPFRVDSLVSERFTCSFPLRCVAQMETLGEEGKVLESKALMNIVKELERARDGLKKVRGAPLGEFPFCVRASQVAIGLYSSSMCIKNTQ